MSTYPIVPKGYLNVIISRARHLPNLRRIEKQNPFCVIRLGTDTDRTTTIQRGGQTPEWGHRTQFIISKQQRITTLTISVFDENNNESQLIGETSNVNIIKAVESSIEEGYDKWYPLTYGRKDAGEIYIEMTFYPFEGTTSPRRPSKMMGKEPVSASPVIKGRRPLPPLPNQPLQPVETPSQNITEGNVSPNKNFQCNTTNNDGTQSFDFSSSVSTYINLESPFFNPNDDSRDVIPGEPLDVYQCEPDPQILQRNLYYDGIINHSSNSLYSDSSKDLDSTRYITAKYRYTNEEDIPLQLLYSKSNSNSNFQNNIESIRTLPTIPHVNDNRSTPGPLATNYKTSRSSIPNLTRNDNYNPKMQRSYSPTNHERSAGSSIFSREDMIVNSFKNDSISLQQNISNESISKVKNNSFQGSITNSNHSNDNFYNYTNNERISSRQNSPIRKSLPPSLVDEQNSYNRSSSIDYPNNIDKVQNNYFHEDSITMSNHSNDNFYNCTNHERISSRQNSPIRKSLPPSIVDDHGSYNRSSSIEYANSSDSSDSNIKVLSKRQSLPPIRSSTFNNNSSYNSTSSRIYSNESYQSDQFPQSVITTQSIRMRTSLPPTYNTNKYNPRGEAFSSYENEQNINNMSNSINHLSYSTPPKSPIKYTSRSLSGSPTKSKPRRKPVPITEEDYVLGSNKENNSNINIKNRKLMPFSTDPSREVDVDAIKKTLYPNEDAEEKEDEIYDSSYFAPTPSSYIQSL